MFEWVRPTTFQSSGWLYKWMCCTLESHSLLLILQSMDNLYSPKSPEGSINDDLMESLAMAPRKPHGHVSLTKTTLTNNNVRGDDSGANEMVGMENLSATLLIFLLQHVIHCFYYCCVVGGNL